MIPATLLIDPSDDRFLLDRRVFGSFVEHMGRCVYTGIFEPGHPAADGAGFRQDVVELVRELGPTIVRYPGGNFVSGYRWRDGIGLTATRPTRLDLAWKSLETNQFGLHEFMNWAALADVEPMMSVNLGTQGVQEALDLLEYCNFPGGTALSDERRANGHDQPFGITTWCLGNEMDGPWQLGHRPAHDYGRIAAECARAMKMFDENLQLVLCGSSNSAMPTFGSWESTVLQECYDDIDLLSMHAYYEPVDGDLASFLASAVDMDRFIDGVISVADSVKATRRSSKSINLSFDEWNVWRARDFAGREHQTYEQAPRLIEEVYSATDAVVVGSLLISLMRHGDRVKVACQAQLVNVIAPILTEPGGAAWRQSIFYPFAQASKMAGDTVLRSRLRSGSVTTDRYGAVDAIDAVATVSELDGALSVFVVNRSVDEDCQFRVETALPDKVAIAASTLSAPGSQGTTVRNAPAAKPMPNHSVKAFANGVELTLPPASWTVLTIG